MEAVARKRGRPDPALNGNGGFAGPKRSKQDTEFPTGLGSKSKPCTKFFSTAGCPFGEGCHFLHYVPGGINAVAHMTNIGNPGLPPPRNHPMGPPPMPDGGPPPAVKTRMCNKLNTPEGCKFGDKCHFAHSEREIGRPIQPIHEDLHRPPPMMGGPMGGGRMGGRPDLGPPPPGLAASFGASAAAKISVDASLAGAIIGKGGVNSKQICRMTGAKLSIREHETDPNLRNIELEGTFDQIKQASAMVRELIVNVGAPAMPPMGGGGGFMGGKPPGSGGGGPHHAPGSNFKTKLCENFTKGSCTFGDRCHFAHGAAELRKPPGV
ncbi:Zinc finger CCCH domain-containing protein 14 [Acorus gramineus]|uniref:Zinc finger CCCH domain-containing protein 14 n=1 Tax=Acorus gramineus TaxID=55184 RepID=A0AAV9AQI1_ACOGR|nr:Zinc finger CCCH domain-containing protein 14 [Acorus gramineus]KAK1266449.1 Zinc finger CCCH domain-containing protein 14 [Acorus gramineus]